MKKGFTNMIFSVLTFLNYILIELELLLGELKQGFHLLAEGKLYNLEPLEELQVYRRLQENLMAILQVCHIDGQFVRVEDSFLLE
jgi:hypothetical protein